jgi:hypothetical protein
LSLLASWFLTVETRRAEKKDTCDNVESGPFGDRVDIETRDGMRFTPQREMANRTTITSQSAGKAIPLETA